MTTGWGVPGFTDIRKVCDDPVGRRVVARHRLSRRLVFVTYLSQEFLTDAEFRRRFRPESAQLMRIHDARVARVHRYIERDAAAAVVADHMPGTSLRELLLDEGALGTDAALVVFKDVLRALAAGQAAGVAHGDLKPESMILTPAGGVRLVDFGLYTGPSRRLLARSTPFYLAPELWTGGSATAAADLYTATVTFFECLVGAPPFHAADAAALGALHQQGTPPFGVIADPIRGLVRDGLAKDPGSRPDPLRFLVQIEEAALDSRGMGWERRGRRELTRLLTVPEHPPPLPVSPVARLGWERRQPVRLAAALGGAMALAAGLSSPVLPNGLFRMQTDSPGSGSRPPVMAFPGPADNAEVQANALQGSTASETEQARSVLLSEPESAVPAAAKSPNPRFGAAGREPALAAIDVHPADDLGSIPSPRSARHDTSPSRSASYERPSPRSANHDAAACEHQEHDGYRGDGGAGRSQHVPSDARQRPREQADSQPTRTDQAEKVEKVEKVERTERGERAQTYSQRPERTHTKSDRAPKNQQRREQVREVHTSPTYQSTAPRPYSASERSAPRQSSTAQQSSTAEQSTAQQSSSAQQSSERVSARQSAVEKMARSGRAPASESRSGSDAATDVKKTSSKGSASVESGTPRAQTEYSAKSSSQGAQSSSRTSDTSTSDTRSTHKSTHKSTGKHKSSAESGNGDRDYSDTDDSDGR